jgi:hypothetical protein
MTENTRGRRGVRSRLGRYPPSFPIGCSGYKIGETWHLTPVAQARAPLRRVLMEAAEPLRHLQRAAVRALASAMENKNHWPLSARRPILRNGYLVFVMNGLDGSGAVDELNPFSCFSAQAGVVTSKHRNKTTINALKKTASFLRRWTLACNLR